MDSITKKAVSDCIADANCLNYDDITTPQLADMPALKKVIECLKSDGADNDASQLDECVKKAETITSTENPPTQSGDSVAQAQTSKKQKKSFLTLHNYHATLGLKERPDAGMSTDGTDFPSGWELSYSRSLFDSTQVFSLLSSFIKTPPPTWVVQLNGRFGVSRYDYQTGVAFAGAPTYLRETRFSGGLELGSTVPFPIKKINKLKIGIDVGGEILVDHLNSKGISTEQVCLGDQNGDGICDEEGTQETGGIPVSATEFMEFDSWATGTDGYLQLKLQLGGLFVSFRGGFQTISLPNAELPTDSIIYSGAFYGFGGGFNF